MRKTKERNRRGSSQLIELGPVIYAAFAAFIFVGVNLSALFCTYASVYLAARDACSAAAKASSFQSALSGISQHASGIAQGPLGKFGNMSPVGGYAGSGADLYLISTNIYTSKTTITGPNKQLRNIDTSANVYECRTDVHYLVMPVVGLSSVPILGDIPGIGRPLMLACSAHKTIEQPAVFAEESAAPSYVVAATTGSLRTVNTQELADWNMWQTPLYLQPGQKLLTQASAVVAANNPSWVIIPDENGTPVKVKKGQRLTIIVQPLALWSYQPQAYATTNGATQWTNGMPVAALEYRVGTQGTPTKAYNSSQNIELPVDGVLYLRCNDSTYSDNSLVQNVKVAVTN